MKNIVVFGKPRTFESYEFEFEEQLATKNENTHIEPYIKPIRPKEAVLHYYVKEDYACYEYYTRANGFDSDRIGGVFGVGIKSDKDIKLFDAQNSVLSPFCKDLSNSFLYNNNSFNTQSIINQVSKTQWSDEEQQTIDSVIDNAPFTKATKGLLLLVVPNFTEIAGIESKIKEYSDVYIADNLDIFKDSNNSLYLKKSNNLIYTVEDGNIVPYKAAKKEEEIEENGKKGFNRGENKNNDSNKNEEPEKRGYNRGRYTDNGNSGGYNSPPPTEDSKTLWERNKVLFSIVGTLIFVGIAWSVFKSCNENSNNIPSSGSNPIPIKQTEESENFTANSVQLANYTNPIVSELDLKPIPLYNGDPKKTTTVSSDITLELKGGASFAKIDGTILKVINRPTQGDAKVTVVVRIKGTSFEAKRDYLIAKKEEEKEKPKQPKDVTPKITANDISIEFAEGNMQSIFFVGNKITATAKIKGTKAESGKWQITNGLKTNSLEVNPIVIEISEYNKDAKIAYIIDGVSKNVPIKISK